tara:strand:+ start:79 stop:774 length:696 start_codon:yes stop_codon:yes gene_type:complete
MRPIPNFHWKNLYRYDPESGVEHSYDHKKYEYIQASYDTMPHQWQYCWNVFYDPDKEYDEEIFDDPTELLVDSVQYTLSENSIIFYKNGKFHLGIKIFGSEHLYDARCFSTVCPTENRDTPFKIFLKDPPPEVPDYWTEDYKLLFKETSGKCVVCTWQLDTKGNKIKTNNDMTSEFDYVMHIRDTRKPEQWPDWLKILVESEAQPSTAKLKIPISAVKPEKYFTDPKNPFA